MRTLPLRWKLTIVASAVMTLTLAGFGTVLYLDQRATLEDQTAASLRQSADRVIASEGHAGRGRKESKPASPTAGPPGGPPLSLDAIAMRLTTRDTAALTVDAHGNVVGDGPVLAGETGIIAPRLDPAVYRAVVRSGEERHLRRDTPEGSVMVELIPLSPREHVDASAPAAGAIQLSTSLDSVDASLNRLRQILVLGTLLALLLTTALIISLVTGLLTPLRRMAAASRAIAQGDLSRRVAVPPGGDELTDLAVAFNEMVSRLEATLATQRRFLADASHELRSPLTALGGGMEMLLLGADRGDEAARSRLMRLMEGEITRMGRLADDLLVLTRFDARPRDALQIAPVDLTALVEEAAETTRLLGPNRTVSVDLPPTASIVVPADTDRLRQALLNLGANARAYTPPGGTIRFGLRQDGTQVTLSVVDTGAGIAPADLPRVWDRFYRADPSRARRAGQGGLGLGLAIVRAIVEAHGGTTTITSTLGAGTTVTLTLPGVAVASVPAGLPAPQTATAVPANAAGVVG